MAIVYTSVDSATSDHDRRSELFDGNFFVYDPRPTIAALGDFTRDTIEQMLGVEPFWAQQRMSEIEFKSLFEGAIRNLSRRRFAMQLVADVIVDLGCDPKTTYASLPTLVAVTGQNFLVSGIGGPRHPHRDTWYAASPSQIHWWISLYSDDEASSLAFHPAYWDRPVANNSAEFDYARWANPRLYVDGALDVDLSEPRPLEAIDLDPEIRIGAPTGGLCMFSAAQLYSVVPNDSLRTRFAVHFHTVSEVDILRGSGAQNLDARPQGSVLSSFLRCDDFSPVPDRLLEFEARRRAPHSEVA
jgi:hypothetical protein